MVFISIYSYVLFCSFHIQQIQNAPSSSHYQIDEFIIQLMSSDKFSELADVIAERAARKIKTVENSNVTLRHNYQSNKPRNTKKTNRGKSTHARVDSVLREGKKTKENSGKFGKVNTKFLKHDVSSQELYLNYKHITKELKKNKEVRNQKELPDHHRDNIFSDHSTEQFKHSSKEKTANVESNERTNIKMKSIDESINKKHSITSDDNYSSKEKTAIINKKVTKKRSGQEDSDEDRTTEVTTEDNNKYSNFKKTLTSQTTKTKDDTLDSSENIKNTHSDQHEESHEDNKNYSSKEIVEVGINRAFSDDSSEHHRTKNLDIMVEDQVKQPIDTKRIIRREKGKLYTFISSPDYDEYHDNVARHKTRDKYINTYK